MVHGMSFNFFATRASDMVNCERSFFFFQVGERDFALMCKYEGGADFGWRGRRVARTSGGADVGWRGLRVARTSGGADVGWRGRRVARNVVCAKIWFARMSGRYTGRNGVLCIEHTSNLLLSISERNYECCCSWYN
jgi:hypothetical protein